MPTRFAGIEIELVPGWFDITDNLDGDAPPTLAREDGVGAIQFSVARYASGDPPGFDEPALHQMLGSRLGSLSERIVTEQLSPCLVVGSEGMMEADRLGAWYASDGTNIAFVTYVGEAAISASAVELEAARAIVHSIRFPLAAG